MSGESEHSFLAQFDLNIDLQSFSEASNDEDEFVFNHDGNHRTAFQPAQRYTISTPSAGANPQESVMEDEQTDIVTSPVTQPALLHLLPVSDDTFPGTQNSQTSSQRRRSPPQYQSSVDATLSETQSPEVWSRRRRRLNAMATCRKRLWSRRDTFGSNDVVPPVPQPLASVSNESDISKTTTQNSFFPLLMQRAKTEKYVVVLTYSNAPGQSSIFQVLFWGSGSDMNASAAFSQYASSSAMIKLKPRMLPLVNSKALRTQVHAKTLSSTSRPKEAAHIDPYSSVLGTNKESSKCLSTKHVPVEIFEQIVSLLSRHDVKQMRLVNRDWEHKVARYLFKSVVVPFNTEIYGLLAKNSPRSSNPKSNAAGKQKRLQKFAEMSLPIQEEPVKGEEEHQIDMFGGFGPHMRHFGITFEVDEAMLCKPPQKTNQNGHDSYWGDYSWPSKDYQRFTDRAGLEVTADETAIMIQAFSKLEEVSHLALAIDSGLGYTKGPDKSLRDRLLEEKPAVFRSTRFQGDPNRSSKRQFWQHLRTLFQEAGSLQDFKCAQACRIGKSEDEAAILELIENNKDAPCFAVDAQFLTSCIEESLSADTFEMTEQFSEQIHISPQYGVLLINASPSCEDKNFRFARSITPNSLSKPQQEWLLETAWAQDAFLSSYMLSIADNAQKFQNVERLTISRISSRHLNKLFRMDFWASLPNLSDMDIGVIADWRDVEKDEIGAANAPTIRPSSAVALFRTLLGELLAPRQSIKSLSIGWVDGGEHASGLGSRNKHLLPAPITTTQWLLGTRDDQIGEMLILPFVQNLTLRNCWVTPNALSTFLNHHTMLQKLEKVTLDSVSLTTHPRFGRPGSQAAALATASPANQAPVVPFEIPLNVGPPADGLFQLQHTNSPVLNQLPANTQTAALTPRQNRVLTPRQNQTLNVALASAQQGPGAPNGPMAGLQGLFIAQIVPYIRVGLHLDQISTHHLQVLYRRLNNHGQQQQPPVPPTPFDMVIALLRSPVPQFPVHAATQVLPHQLPHSTIASSGPREGSWPWLLNTLDAAVATALAAEASQMRGSNDHFKSQSAYSFIPHKTLTLHLKSVGYARLRTREFDQSVLDQAERHQSLRDPQASSDAALTRHGYFVGRREALDEMMIPTTDEWLGTLVSAMPFGEFNEIQQRFGCVLKEGWPWMEDGDEEEEWLWGRWGDETADAALCDGQLKGGTGRFSGTVVVTGSIDLEDGDEDEDEAGPSCSASRRPGYHGVGGSV